MSSLHILHTKMIISILRNHISHFSVLCPVCRTANKTKWEVSKGMFTVFGLNRIDWDVARNTKALTKLSEGKSRHSVADSLCHDLVACINHIGKTSTQGHFVTYTKTDDGVWWRNDESKKVKQYPHHPFKATMKHETTDLLIFKNI